MLLSNTFMMLVEAQLARTDGDNVVVHRALLTPFAKRPARRKLGFKYVQGQGPWPRPMILIVYWPVRSVVLLQQRAVSGGMVGRWVVEAPMLTRMKYRL